MTRPRNPSAQTWPLVKRAQLACALLAARDERAKIRENWVAACRQAAAAEPANLRLEHLLARALSSTGRRDEAIVLWRELGEQNDADTAFEIYDIYKSYFRSDVNAPQLVTRAEAERQFRDREGGCALAAKDGSQDGDPAAGRWRAECEAN